MKAVFIGRFQPLHKGHFEVIEKYREEYSDFVAVIGSAEKERERENPLSFEERKEILQACFPDLEILGLADHESDEIWVNNLLEKAEPDVVISQNDLVKQLVREHTDAEVFEQEMHDEGVYSGTEIRRRIRSGEEWRYLVPECAAEKIAEYTSEIKESGIQYEFAPGWKKENAYHDTYEK